MDTQRRSSIMQNFLKMLNLSNTPTVPMSDDELTGEADEPPDHVSELRLTQKDNSYTRTPAPPKYTRRESLLTRAILAGSKPSDLSPTSPDLPHLPRGLSTASSHSFASTAELTSDGGFTSPARSASPSPPPIPSNRLVILSSKPLPPTNKVTIAPVTKEDKPDIVPVGEAAIEKTLGRKRCIMFACGNASSDASKESSPIVLPKPETQPAVPTTRKCRLTFACPTRQDSNTDKGLTGDLNTHEQDSRRLSLAPPATTPRRNHVSHEQKSPRGTVAIKVAKLAQRNQSPRNVFHEFASSHDETDAWVEQAGELAGPKMTLDDVLRKENAIRRIGKEAEEEAEEEEREQEEMDNEIDEIDGEDDFAPSDDDNASDGGNESDDEGGFAESDDESDAGSDYQFWAPATSTAPTSTDNLTHISSRQRSRSRNTSVDSTLSESDARGLPPRNFLGKRRLSKIARMRPGTPELPDSTDFVCGTLDEDRLLEAAYISCRQQKLKEKHVPIPQDIDPSFPTTDPEEEEDDDDEDEENIVGSNDNMWLKDQFRGFEDDERGRRRASTIKVSPLHSPAAVIAPPRPVVRPQVSKRGTHRSPPPKHNLARSPAPPRRLFGHSPTRLRSPPPTRRLRSPRGSPTNDHLPPLGITITRLAQRPNTDRTSSLPHTPNPFFRNRTPPRSRIASGAVTPSGEDEYIRPDLHIRGPVDIVVGLEKKRQKRKEKFWRQHCRKVAKEQADRKTVPGRGAERMKELGLECAERTRGYNLGQQAQLVISL